jgi:tetratricopeptide (TPR) repeat protein
VAKRSSRRNAISVQRAKSGNGWVLVHPSAVREMAEDLEELQRIIDAGETDVAVDELRWLLGTCPEMIEGHFLLGKLAAEVNHDVPLARGHFGTAYQLGIQALRRAKRPKPVPALHPANRTFYNAGRGLVWCLDQLGKHGMALEVVEQMLELDPDDPLGLSGWLDEIRTAGKPMVDLENLWQGPPM